MAAHPISAIVVVIATILLPPLGIFLVKGLENPFWICLLLTVLGYFPGHIYGFYYLYKYYSAEGIAGDTKKEL